MGLPGGTPPARLFLALCVWRLALRRGAAGTEEVVFGKVGGSILLLCRNVSKEATEVVWFQGDPHSFPPLFSSRVAFPPDVRFSLVDNSSLRITELRLQDEGNYTCKEVLNKTDHEHRVQLLVASKSVPCLWVSPMSIPLSEIHLLMRNLSVNFQRSPRWYMPWGYPPQSTLKCWAETSSSGLMLQLFCSWPGGYPHPTLHWREEGHDLENSSWVISSTRSSDTHVETLNSSHLAHRKVFKCVGSHVVEQEEPACSVEIKLPSLESDPPQTCLVGDNVTLTCRLTEGVPAARLSWLRGITQPEIQPGGRFLIAQEGNVSRLTIQNCSQGTDGGCYVCKAQNPVGLREMFVCLTVKQPTNIVGVVGAVATLSLMAVLTISGLILYYNPLLCLRGRSSPPRQLGQDSGDVLVLVDSEDDDYEEEKGEEDAVSSSKYELVNGSSAPAAYLSCLAGGEPCCLLWGRSCEAVGFWKAASGEGGTPVLTSLALAEVLLLCR
uniref:V-set and immunoglobulin domain containing 10 n=1 Tax=Anas platyrhynchos platyrhynchos TaxID=8840 RepID=U3J0E9_ANAPP